MKAPVYCPWHGQWDGHPDGVEMNLCESVSPFGFKTLYWYECPICGEGSPAADTRIQAWINAIRRFRATDTEGREQP